MERTDIILENGENVEGFNIFELALLWTLVLLWEIVHVLKLLIDGLPILFDYILLIGVFSLSALVLPIVFIFKMIVFIFKILNSIRNFLLGGEDDGAELH